MAQEVRIRGLAELNQALKKLPDQMRERVWKLSIAAGAREIRKAVRRRAPRGRGHLTLKKTRRRVGIKRWHLRDSINVVNTTGGRATKYIRFRIKSDDPKAHLLEYGVKPHIIEARKIRKILRLEQGGRVGVIILPNGKMVPRVKHPGHKAFPFFGPAFDESYGRAITKMADRASKAIQKLRIKTK